MAAKSKVEFKLSTMVFDAGTEFTFYNNHKRMFIMVKNGVFQYNGNRYETNMMHTKWNVAADIMKKIGYTNVKKEKINNAYNVITGVK